MTHSKDIAGLLMRAETAARIMSEYEAWEPPVPPPVDPVDYAWTAQVITDLVAALRPAADPKAEGPWPPIEQAIEIGPEPAVEWEDPRVQAVYEILCRDFRPPNEGEHWEGYQARLIVDALAATPTPDAERAGEPGWHEHDGKSDPPLPGDTFVQVRFRDLDEHHCGVVHDWDEGWQWAAYDKSHDGDIIAYRRLYAASQSPATEAVRIKPLEWRDMKTGASDAFRRLMAEGPFNVFHIDEQQDGQWQLFTGYFGSAADGHPKMYPTLETAQAAGQEIQQRLILSALIRPPAPGGEHIVADVSKAAADTEGATKP